MTPSSGLLRSARALAIATMAFLGVCRAGADETDWGRAVADSTMRQNPSAAEVPWRYPRALYMLGQHRLYRRTGNGRYLRYLEDWGEAHVDEEGIMYCTPHHSTAVNAKRETTHTVEGINGL